MKTAARRLKRKDLEWLSYEEILAALAGQRVAFSRRGQTAWALARSQGWRLISGLPARQLIKRFKEYFFKAAGRREIPAVIANRGLYIGRVRLVRTLFSNKIREEIKKVEKGEVLVAETTGPEMVPAMRRAGAIVTDEGGLTSHAAIIARELGKPCLVGAKIATKVLHDGDLVKVDAEKGKVEILDRLKS